MKNRLIITVSDIKGTSSYNVHQIVKKIGVIIVIVILSIIASGFWFVNNLNLKIDNLKIEKQKEIGVLLDKEQELLDLNKIHALKIQNKIKDIEELSSTLDNIEEIIGINSNGNFGTENVITKAKLLEATAQDKLALLEIIPNGYPLKKTSVVSNFGYRKHPIQKKRKFHRGIDLEAKRNTRIYATANGVVRHVQPRNIGDFGRLIIISHNYGFETIYAHLQKTKVKIGDIIKKGEVIGLSGSSGRSTGPHLHYEVRHASRILNPKPFIKWNLINYENLFLKERRIKWESLMEMINQTKTTKAQL